jgi:hypothetical protein
MADYQNALTWAWDNLVPTRQSAINEAAGYMGAPAEIGANLLGRLGVITPRGPAYDFRKNTRGLDASMPLGTEWFRNAMSDPAFQAQLWNALRQPRLP